MKDDGETAPLSYSTTAAPRRRSIWELLAFLVTAFIVVCCVGYGLLMLLGLFALKYSEKF